MDESRKPGNFAPANYPSQVEDGFGENPGATGVFGTAPPLQADRASGSLDDIDQDDNSGQREEFRVSAPPASVPASREGLQEPVVHKVVMGGGSAAAPIDLLELLRTPAPAAESAPGAALAEGQARANAAFVAAQPAQPSEPRTHQPSEGFTQLLSALGRGGSHTPVSRQPEPVQKAAPVSASNLVGQDSGFTELLRRPNTENPARQAEKPLSAREPAPSPAPSDGASGFTSLLQGFSGKAPASAMRQATPASMEEKNQPVSPLGLPDQNRGAGTTPPPGQAGPGTFTQLFSTVTSNAAEARTPGPSSPVAPLIPSPVKRPSPEEASFTQLISTIGDTPYKASAGGVNRAPDVADFLHMPAPGREAPLASSQRPSGNTDWPREIAPPQQPLPASAGITRLLRVLDEPAKEPERAVEYPPAGASAPAASESFFTQTYKKLEGTPEPVSPAPQPPHAPPPNIAAAQPFASPFNSASYAEQGQSAPVVPSVSTGPSEVTRILDASKLREMQRGGAAAPASAPAAAQPSPAPMSFPTPPALPNLQWQPPVPHAPAPGQPMHFGGGMQMPQYAMPPVPQPPAPAAPTPAAPAANKMQQYLPLLLIVIIFLLVVILVTVVFLLKH